ncbi:MAG: BMP family ABC transporter substrate-binding protein [Lachnospiraceae bacterium]|nr:BMP family ABC transporter substrate-binding protein [Lachnospiraceae bacterium]
MKKKILALLMCATMVFGMTACGGTGSGNGTEGGKEGDTLRIGMVTDIGGVNDGSFNQSSWEGLQRAEEELGIEADYLESKTDADYVPNLETLIDEEYDLIISVGYKLADATKEAANANPDQKFAIIDDATCADLDNVTCLMFKQEQASYLVGYVAGLMTEKDNVGIVLGMASENMHLFGYGYVAGVVDANPDCKVQQINANSFADPATGKTNANTMVTNGADIIFHAAGGTGNGVIDGCTEAGIKAIGVDSDQAYLAPQTIITSAMKRVDNAVYECVKSLQEDKLEAGVMTYDITNGGVDIAPTTDLLPEEVITAVNGVKEKLLSGEIVVPASKDEFNAKYGDIYELD